MGITLRPEEGQRLTGKVALITGAAHGIGRAYALRFAAEGARVAIADLDLPGAEIVAKEIAALNGEAIAVALDVTDPAIISDAVNKVVGAYGTVDILLNNAAMFSVVPMSRVGFDALSIEEWDAMMSTNVKGPWLMSRAVAPIMRTNQSGKIINISSGTAFKGTNTQIHYVTSKAAVLGFTKTLARELGGDGINVNAIAPGNTLSEEDPDDKTVTMRSSAISSRALRRLESPEDIVGAAVFLASNDSDFITGQTIIVDGGSVMH
ncbi:MAG TPA: SDR family oxidoreductase [Acidimicrobiales bacterium]|nr:SDR family oxidoreductase [Acidimicrobiales bacterium]